MSKIQANVLVSGAAGFLGSSAVASLLESGAHVKALCHTHGERLAGLHNPNLEVIGLGTDGFHDRDFLTKALEGIDVVYHFAINWQGHIWKETGTLDKYVHDNLNGTLNLLQASKAGGIKQFIYASSAIVYGVQKARMVDEESICLPETWNRDPGPAYCITKLAAEKLCHICAKEFGFQLTKFRIGVVFDEKIAILPDPVFVRKILRGENVEVQREVGRTSIHIDDAVQAFLLATLNSKAYGQTFNLSNPETFISDKDMYQFLVDTAHSKSEVLVLPKPSASPPIESMAKTKRILGWKAQKSLDVLKVALAGSLNLEGGSGH